MPYALGQLHNCHHIPPPSHPSLQFWLLTPPPTPAQAGVGGGGVNNNLSIFSAVHEISLTFEMLPPPPPHFPWEPPPPEWGGSTIFFSIGFWTVRDISRSFYFWSLNPPPRGYADIPGESLPVSFGWDTKSRWSLLSGVYARGSKRSH